MRATIAFGSILLALAANSAQGQDMDHAAHGSASAAEAVYGSATEGVPSVPALERWATVPGGGAFIDGSGFAPDLRCVALFSDPRLILDRETQAACDLLALAGPEDTEAAPRAGQTHIVRMVYDRASGDFAFLPERLEIEPGDTVIWINDDGANEHNAAAYPDRIPADAELFEGPLLTSQGQSWAATFTVPGSYYYHCHPHEAVMRGLIVVGRESVADEFRAPAEGEMTHDHGIETGEHDENDEMGSGSSHGD